MLQHPAQCLQAAGVGQAEVEQHARRAGDEPPRVSQRARPLHYHVGVRLSEQFLHEERVAIVVLDQQHPQWHGMLREAGAARCGVSHHEHLRGRCQLAEVGRP